MSTVAGVALSVVIALVVGLAAFVYSREKLANKHSMAGGVTAGVLALLAALDLSVEPCREFWTQRPMLAATVTGGLLLGFTVVVVDGVLERRRADAMNETMKSVLAKPITSTQWGLLLGDLTTAHDALSKVRRPREVVGDPDVRWSQQPGIEKGLTALTDSTHAMEVVVPGLRGDLLFGGPQMHPLYQACWSLAFAGRSVEGVVSDFREWLTPEYDACIRLGTPTMDDDIGYAEWRWNAVGRAYNQLSEAVNLFNEAAQAVTEDDTDVGATVRIISPAPLEGFPAPTRMYYL